MAKFSLISYHDPKIGSWTLPEPIQGIGEEAMTDFVQRIERTIKAGKVAPENDGFECYRVAIFDDDEGKIVVLPSAEHLIDLHAPHMASEEVAA